MEQKSKFDIENRVAPLGIVTVAGAEDLAKQIDQHLLRWSKKDGLDFDSFIIESNCPRFQTGDGKGMINSTIRGKDLFFIVDVGNYSITYDYFGHKNHMSPDDHYQDLKRLIQAASGKGHRVNVIMPILYGGRQDKRNFRESLDGAFALQELRAMGVSNVATFDAHNPMLQNAIPLMGFDNLMPTYQVLKSLFTNFPTLNINCDKFMIVSPDAGALNRNMFYASVLGVDMGMFYKRRDYSKIVNGINPIVAHEYMGESMKGKCIFAADDIIASGGSMLDVAYTAKENGASKFFCYGTYAMFTSGLSAFDKAYEDGVIDGVFGTNLTYLNPELKNREWFYEVDASKYVAYFILALNQDLSISKLIDPHEKIETLIAEHKKNMN